MKLKLLFIMVFVCIGSYAQTGVGTVTPHASAALDVESTTKGFLPPRMTQAQMEAVVNPVEGLIIYCLDCDPKGIYVYDGVNFIDMVTGQVVGYDAAFAEILEDSASSEGANNANGIAVTFQQLALTGVTGLDIANLAGYQGAIAAETGFSNPPTQAEVQAIIDLVNNPAIPGNTTCAFATISHTPCTATELANGIGTNASDGQPYDVVQIGDQCWMAENIDTGVADSGGWTSDTDTGWYGYYNTTFQADKEGTLFQWSAAMDGATQERAQGVCPPGWHVPSDCEWMYLENTLGMSVADQESSGNRGTTEGTQLKSGGSSGFEALLSGYRTSEGGSFSGRGSFVDYLSSTENSSNDNFYIARVLTASGSIVNRDLNREKSYSRFVRCLKD